MVKKYFQSTASERKGAVVLLCVIFCLSMSYFFSANNDLSIIVLKNQLSAQSESISKHNINTTLNTNHYFEFEPNQLNKDGWIKLGFSERQVKTIMNYKKAIGGFTRPEQLLKLYVIDSSLYEELYPYIKIKKEIASKLKVHTFKSELKESKAILLLESNNPVYDRFGTIDDLFYKKHNGVYKYYTSAGNSDSAIRVKLKHVTYVGFDSAIIVNVNYSYLNDISLSKSKEIIKNVKTIHVNRADTNDYKSLKGIGTVLANRIVDFRNLLGGFIDIVQIKGVYGLKLETYLSIEGQMIISDSSIQRLNINKLDIESLYRHPYIDWNLANALVQYRFQHGDYKSIDKIKSIHLVNDKIYCKIAPYLTTE